MDVAQRTDEPFLAELTVIQFYEVHHAPQDGCTERIRFTVPRSHDQPQGFAVDFLAHLVVQLESGAHAADAVIAQLQAVIVESQTNPVGGCEKRFGRSIAAHDLGAQLDARRQRCGVAVLFSKEQGFLLHRQAGIDLAENRQIPAAIAENAPLDGVLTVHHIISAVAEADFRLVGDILVKVGGNQFHLTAMYSPLIDLTRIDQLTTVNHHHLVRRGDIERSGKIVRVVFQAHRISSLMPKEIGVILMNRIRIIAVLAVSISLLGIFLLLYEMYRVAKEYARSSQLDRENQLLAVESRRYMELRSYLEQTRHLRHDFRQHLHVISGLTEAGRLDELKSYLSQYESELSDARPTLCVNAAVDALAGHYDYEARKQGIQIEWKLELPKLLPLPEADLCTILGNLLENALHASQKLPPEERQVKVLARMLSPAMMGLMVENRYDGVLKKQGGVLHSTKHDGQGIGLVSVETAVHRYHGNLTVETGGNVFRANVLLNL